MSGSKSRLGTAGDAKGGLKIEDADKIIQNYKNSLPENDKNKTSPGKRFFDDTSVKRNPLLIIYHVAFSHLLINIITKNINLDKLF